MAVPAPGARVRTSAEIRAGAIAEGHKSERADRLEDSVFGVLDGVITAISLSVATAGVARIDHAGVLLTIVAAAVAGSLSMFTGALLSGRAKADLIRSERAREEREVEELPEEERREVHDIYRNRGLSEEETQVLVQAVTSNKRLWVDTMMREELGLPPEPESEPLTHAGTIGIFYLIGGILPGLPYLLTSLSLFSELELSVAVGSAELAAVGLLSSIYSTRSWYWSLAEILAVGLGTAGAVLLVTLAVQPGI
jgi:VIT1/CCC1 family predicted Fe2+/Mn2+ transporter